jgi:hypothetical protein
LLAMALLMVLVVVRLLVVLWRLLLIGDQN